MPDDETDKAPPHDSEAEEPLGPMTPDDEISPHDLPLDHPGREQAERMAGGGEGTTRGNV